MRLTVGSLLHGEYVCILIILCNFSINLYPIYGWSLIAGLDCGLDRWTGLLDWITGLTFELKLCVSRDLHPIRCAELGHMFDA